MAESCWMKQSCWFELLRGRTTKDPLKSIFDLGEKEKIGRLHMIARDRLRASGLFLIYAACFTSTTYI